MKTMNAAYWYEKARQLLETYSDEMKIALLLVLDDEFGITPYSDPTFAQQHIEDLAASRNIELVFEYDEDEDDCICDECRTRLDDGSI